ADCPLPQEREIGDREARGVADLGQRIRAALRREPRRKEMVEQDGKLPRRLRIRLGLRLCTHTDTPLKAGAARRRRQEPARTHACPAPPGTGRPPLAARTSPAAMPTGTRGNWH